MTIQDVIEKGAHGIIFGKDITYPLCTSLAQGSPTLAAGLISEEINLARKIVKERTFI